MKKKLFFVFVAVFIIGFIIVSYLSEWRYSAKIISSESLILSGDEKLEIIDTKYVQNGDIILSGNAQLIVRDSLFLQKGEGSQAFSLRANDNSKVIFENSVLKTSKWIDWSFSDNSELIYNKTSAGVSWHSFGGSSSLLVIESAFGGTIYDDSKFVIRDSPNVALELYVYENEVISESGLRKGKVDSFVFPNEGEENIGYSIDIKNSKIRGWGIGVGPRGTMSLKDSEDITICLPVHAPYINESIYFDNLKKDFYEDRTIKYAGTTLLLERVSTRGWCMNSHNENTIYVTNSDIDDINHNGGNGRMFYENVTSNVAITSDNNYLELKNSVIKGDVVAKGNSTIVLINTKVKGKILERDNGSVIIQDR